ncbi:hypothetical protein EIP91_011568 [Steccherinum ochraceum]|uniref:Wbp11/ELF5/Saf1 N-terminal domain-containing protein n=1 Tax=Steccherinum ochraceum TaxID=92696 RepID=A0A4R0RPN9_9APHY|nr:hypothetical protein EIP91_011568 [Steccherinum ochraceum]
MAKGKSANPADAFSMSLNSSSGSNKAERAKARDFALVKKDTRDLEVDIENLESGSNLSPADTARLKELKDELAKVNQKKEEYVTEHPEHRKLVFRSKKHSETSKDEDEPKPELRSRRMFDKNGLPRHPERSIYYDPVMNPYGVAPPGMPYVERPLRPDEVDSDQEEMPVDSDDDIVMPAGPPPDADDDSDDDIPMPEGPPPLKEGAFPVHVPPLPSLSSLPPPAHPPLPPHNAIPSHPGFPPHIPQGLPPPPPSPGFSSIPPPLPGFPSIPPPPPGFSVMPPPLPSFSGHLPMHSATPFPPPPPGFFPRRNQSAAAMQDPLSSIPHQTFQAHRASLSDAPPHPSLPPKPSQAPPTAAVSSAATVSAAPELRDLKKESTAFVPSALKRKKAGAAASTSSQVNAAPSVGPTDGEEIDSISMAPRPDLLGTLKGQFGNTTGTTESSQKKTRPGDDYTKFMAEMGDILGPAS